MPFGIDMRRISRLLLLALAYASTLAAQSTADKPQPDVPPNPLGDAKALARKGDFDGAIEKYQKLLQERPKSPDAYAGLTRVYLMKEDVTQAYETVTKALQVTDSWPVRVALGEVYFRQGKFRTRKRSGSM
jgi:tetratricopeptide (TPR) repeat protein